MTTRTKTELAQNVGLHLNLIDAEGSLESRDHDYIVKRYLDLWAEFEDDKMAYWDADAIPAVVFEALTQIMALSVGPAFGRRVTVRDLDDGLNTFRRRIRRHTRVRSADLPAETESF